MTESSITVAKENSKTPSRLWDFVNLTKPRISVMVLAVVAVTGYVASIGGAEVSPWAIFHAVVGTFFVAASGSAFNMYVERWLDARMNRTSARPLPARRLTSMEEATFGAVCIGIGFAYLGSTLEWRTASLGFLTWFMYVFVYTPLKTRTWINTIIGAIAGAMPVLIAWSATGVPINALCWSLFLLLFLWQFPHFMAIAWLFREDYADGGMKMLPVVDSSGFWAGIEAVLTAALILPVCWLPISHLESGGLIYAVIVTLLSGAYLAASVVFLRARNDQNARTLLRVSLVHLPFVLLTLVFVSLL